MQRFLPFYQELQEDEPALSLGGNYGLWFERFFDQYDPRRNYKLLEPEAKEFKKPKKGKRFWLKKYFTSKGEVGNEDALLLTYHSNKNLMKSIGGASCLVKNTSPFVTGMGSDHPVENGLLWHPTLGVPYLSGASLKGLVRSYLEARLELEDTTARRLLLEWFGSVDKDPQKQTIDNQSGAVIFFDALPVNKVVFDIELMTPHMGDWYSLGAETSNQANTLPADWHDPVPIPFLVTKSIVLNICFSLRSEVASQYSDEMKAFTLSQVKSVLLKALQHDGAGGKTALGFGRFDLDEQCQRGLEKKIHSLELQRKRECDKHRSILEEKKKELEEKEYIDSLDPVEQNIHKDPSLNKVVEKIENGGWSGDPKVDAIYVKKYLQKLGKWKEQSAARKPEKDKAFQLTKRVMKYL